MSDDKPGKLWGPLARQMAVTKTEELLLKGYGPREILAELSTDGVTDSISTVRDYCREVHRQWAEEDLERRPARRDMWRARLEARYRKMLHDLDDTYTMVDKDGTARKMPAFVGLARAKMYDSLAKLELLAFRLDGLDAPIKIEHTGAIDVRAMSPEVRRQRIDELLAKRREAVAEIAGDN